MEMEWQPELFKEFPQSADPRRRPKKGVPGLASTGTAKLQLIQCYHWPSPAQAFSGWRREAARLFCEFWRTGGNRHLLAFVRHVMAMRTHQVRGGQ
jgi:hypothetical protein